jgi:hypothetical protein
MYSGRSPLGSPQQDDVVPGRRQNRPRSGAPGPTLPFESAIQFLALAVPSSAARVALEIRFFQRVRVPATGAAALSTTLAFRLVTFYLPPIWGAPAMRWLRTHSYL